MAKETYHATIEVCRSYLVPIQATSLEQAGAMAKDMNVSAAEEDGENEDFEINVLAVTKEKRMMYQ